MIFNGAQRAEASEATYSWPQNKGDSKQREQDIIYQLKTLLECRILPLMRPQVSNLSRESIFPDPAKVLHN